MNEPLSKQEFFNKRNSNSLSYFVVMVLVCCLFGDLLLEIIRFEIILSKIRFEEKNIGWNLID